MPDAAPVLETPRLRLRGWTDADRPPFAALNADPRVGELLGGTLTAEQTDAWIDRMIERWRDGPFSLWAVERREDSAFLGCVGLSVPSFAPEPTPEIGWRLAFDAWGRGYATEAARGVVAYAFDVLELPELVSYTAAINMRSRRVMEKLGMARRDPDAPSDFDHPRLAETDPLRPHVTYRLARTTWLATRAS